MGEVESRPCPNCVPDPPANIINRSGSDGNYIYTVIGNANLPVVYVGPNDIRRFANWLHNGATTNADTENGAYGMSGGGWFRDPMALWWIPTDNEWAKAAYYKGGGVDSGYWLYPTQSDLAPASSKNSTSMKNTANYNSTNTTVVGSFSGSPSAYGTFDQGGNVHEATQESVLGGGFESAASRLLPTARPSRTPQENRHIGFRVAKIADNFENKLQVVESSFRGNGFSLSWYPQGVNSKIQRRNSLNDSIWQDVTNYDAFYRIGTFTDTNTPQDKAFYRIIIE